MIASFHARDMRTPHCRCYFQQSLQQLSHVQYSISVHDSIYRLMHQRPPCARTARHGARLSVRTQTESSNKIHVNFVSSRRAFSQGFSCRTFTVSIPGQSWDLWWTKWHWNSFFATSTSASHCRVSFHQNYVRLQVAFTGRTEERNLRASQKLVLCR